MADELVKKRITEYGTEVAVDELDNSDVIFVDSTQHGTRKLRLKGVQDAITKIQNEGIKSSGVSVTSENYSTTITDVNNQPVNTIYAYGSGLQSSIANLPSNAALSIMHYTYKHSVATGVGQVMIAIERSGESPAIYFRSTSGSPVTWGSWVKVANSAEVWDEITDIKADLNNYPYGLEPFEMSLFKPTVNLFSDFCYHYLKGYYRQRTSTSPKGRPRITTTTLWQGWLIRVKPDTTYALGPVDFKIELLNSEFNIDLAIGDLSDTEPNIITTGSNSYWMCLTQKIDRDMSGWMMVEGDTYPSEYISGTPEWVKEPKSAAFDDLSANVDSLSSAVSSMGNDVTLLNDGQELCPYGVEPFQMSLFKQTTNLFSDFCYHTIKHYYRFQPDATKHYPRISEGLNWQGWLIRVKPSTTYAIGPIDFRIEFLKSDSTLDTRFDTFSDTEPNIITTGSNSYWMCLTQKIDRDMSGWMMVEGDTYPSEYISGTPQWIAEPLPPTTSRNKTIAFMGDSITAGVAAQGMAYHMFLHERYGWTCLNYGYGGSGYYQSSTSKTSGRVGMGVPGLGPATTSENAFTPNNVVARLAEVNPSTTNAIVIFAGTNDWGNSVSIENFISGIEAAFDYCKTNFSAIPVLVMTPIHRIGDTVPNDAGKTLREYADIIIEECKKYSMPYVDTMTVTGMYPDNQANCALFFPDNPTSGLHPGKEGHKRLANAIGETLAETLRSNDFS